MSPTRRNLLAGAAAAAPLAWWTLGRPSAKGGEHDSYFKGLSQALNKANLQRPTMVVDLPRLKANISTLKGHIPAGMDYRIVAKSLPSDGIIDTVMREANTQRLMVFHQPFLNHIAKRFPEADCLLGKPMPVGAAARFYEYHQGDAFLPSRQIQWLIDTAERLAEYAQLSRGLQQTLRINLELDIGLHRGGFTEQVDIAAAISAIGAEPYLEFAGFMGYEPHILKVPGIFGGPEQAKAKADSDYQAAIATAKQVLGSAYDESSLTYNTGGSGTYTLYDVNSHASELAVGSALVKPSDFDYDTLSDHRQAAFIATPVLKALDKTQLPGAESLSSLFKALDPNTAKTFFTYGGKWLADPISPPGLQRNSLYGSSTNQEMLNGSIDTVLGVGDHVFLRPRQSEFVFLQFGDIAVYDGEHIVDSWPIFQQGA